MAIIRKNNDSMTILRNRKFHSIVLALLFAVVIFVLPEVVFAGGSQTDAFQRGANFSAARDPRGIVSLLANTAMIGLGTIITLYTFWGGYLVLTGGGKEERLTRGKRTLWTSLAGTAILLSGYGIVRFTILLVDYVANDEPDYRIDDGFSVDVDFDPYVNRPNDPRYDDGIQDPEGRGRDLGDILWN